MSKTTSQRKNTVSALRNRLAHSSFPQIPAGLSTFLARAALGGFALFLLALANHS